MATTFKHPIRRIRQQVETPGRIGTTRLRTYDPATGTEYGYYDAPALQKQSLTVMNDVVTPGYAQRMAAGEIINHSMSKVSTLYGSSSGSGGEFQQIPPGLRWACDGDGFQHVGFTEPAASVVDTTNLVHLAQTAALAGVKKPDLQTFVALGELHKTLALTVSPIRALSKLLANSAARYKRDLAQYGNRLNSVMKITGHTRRHKKLVEFKRRVKDGRIADPINVHDLEFIPDMVLAYNLGWKPLLMDIDALLHKIPAKEYAERLTSRSTKSDSSTYSREGTAAVGNGNSFAYTDDITETVIVRAGVLYTGSFEASTHFGTRLADVPSSVWELIPFSFLADYAVNIGDYIESLTVSLRAQTLAFYTKTTILIEVVRTLTHGVPAPNWSVTRQPSGSLDVLYKAVIRDASPFQGNIAHTPVSGFRPPAQLQNVLSLLTKTLYGASIWKAR